MKTYKFNNKIYEVDDQSFLIDYEKWDEDFAVGMADELLLSELGDLHWRVIYYIRNQFQKTGVCPLVYKTCKKNNLNSKTFKELFPTGYLRGACLLAGITYKDRWVDYRGYGEGSHITIELKKQRSPGKIYRIDAYGYLVEPDEWDEEFAINRALEMNIQLTDRHRRIIHFLRDMYSKNKKIPTIFECCEANALEIIDIESLFPTGYHRCAIKIAGLPSLFFLKKKSDGSATD